MSLSLRELAEVLHAEQHPSLFVPTLDSCETHSRQEWENRVRSMYPGAAYAPEEYRLWNDQGTNKIYIRHDPCGTDSEPVSDFAAAEQFRDQHICPEEAAHA